MAVKRPRNLVTLFQFHKGTIKAAYGNTQSTEFSQFQFHKGTIKAPCFWIYNILIFNRICECKVKKSYKKNVDG